MLIIKTIFTIFIKKKKQSYIASCADKTSFVKNAIKKPVEVLLIWKISMLLVKMYCETLTPIIYSISGQALGVILAVNLPLVFAKASTR